MTAERGVRDGTAVLDGAAVGVRAPLTDRGRRTRAALVAAARTVFEDRGFADTRMSDIAEAAGVSHGTVYTYFNDKTEVLVATLEKLVNDIRDAIRTSDAAEPAQRIASANLQYLRAYVSHARLFRVAEGVSISDDRFSEIIGDLRRTHSDRVAGQISRYQQAGIVRADADPNACAAALTAMVEGFARNWPDRVTADLQGSADTLSELWVHGLDLRARAQTAELLAEAGAEPATVLTSDQHNTGKEQLEETDAIHT